MDLILELQNKIKELNLQLNNLSKMGSEYAEAYSRYRIALRQELLKLKDEGMAVTLAYDVARGKPEIARLKFNEISKEALYKANQESIQAIKLQIRIIEAQLEREYSNERTSL